MRTHFTPLKYTFFLWLFALFLLGQSTSALHAQSPAERQKLEAKRKKLQKEIDYTNSLLTKTRKSKRATTRRYQALLHQVKARQELISTLQEEIDWLDKDIQRDSLVAEALQDDLKRLEEEFGSILRSAFRQKLNENSWLFVLSAASINEMLRRWLLLRQYRRFRKRQAAIILDTRNMLQKRIKQLEERRKEKTGLLEEEQSQTDQLARELTEKDRLLRNLRRDEVRLKKELKQKKAASKRLNNAIADIIRKAEAERHKAERPRKSTTGTPSTTAPPNTAMDPPSQSFFSLRGHLPWPVKKGVVVENFGTHPHPTAPGLTITNNGIDIRTDAGAKVLAVQQGEVVGVQFIPSSHYLVIIRHGIFYTVYSNLESLLVKKGSKVSRGQALGTVYTSPQTGSSELHFEIWRNKDHLNPSNWLKKR